MSPTISCRNMVRRHEGCILHAYLDVAGVWTIGWGTTIYPNGNRVKQGDQITQEQADKYLDWQINLKSVSVNAFLHGITISQNRFDSLVDFAYNEGVGALEHSTLLKKIKSNPDDPTIYKYSLDGHGKPMIRSCEFLKWVLVKNPMTGLYEVSEDLVSRRKEEADLYALM